MEGMVGLFTQVGGGVFGVGLGVLLIGSVGGIEVWLPIVDSMLREKNQFGLSVI